MSFVEIKMNASRICDGLSKIGYTPPSAITDIIDNAVQAQAKNIHVVIVPATKTADARRRNNVREYLIIDDGIGMDYHHMLNALSLGSPSDEYMPHSLSKFGLGLKSASFSQGEVLEVISSTGEDHFRKLVVSLPRIRETNLYGAEEVDLSDEDYDYIERYLPENHGTIIRVAEVRMINHPSIGSTVKELKKRIGVIYYYMMSEEGVRILIDGQECDPFDVLFADEANLNGNLDENTWDGRSTTWIQRPTQLILDPEMGVTAIIEVTQLPHPPTFALDGPGQQRAAGERYMIEAGNYGFYVYRNKRLLSWAESFDIIPQDQDYYSFRGRIIVDESADDVLNIDVKKSHLHLSEEASRALDDISDQYKRKSKKAWKHAGDEIKRRTNTDAVAQTNSLLQRLDIPDELPGLPDTEQQHLESQKREQELIDEQTHKMEELAAETIGISPNEEIYEETLQEALQTVIAGESATKEDRIFLVSMTDDNVLWEPYFDADKGTCVRINKMHRFARAIYEDNPNNGSLIFYFGALLLQLASAESFMVRRYTHYSRDQYSEILQAFRRNSTDYLSEMCRQLGSELPRE